jgi:hypothetical protein
MDLAQQNPHDRRLLMDKRLEQQGEQAGLMGMACPQLAQTVSRRQPPCGDEIQKGIRFATHVDYS